MENRPNQQASAAAVDTSDRIAEADGRLVGEADRKAEHPLLPAGAEKSAGAEVSIEWCYLD
jgi:hypothetical protein